MIPQTKGSLGSDEGVGTSSIPLRVTYTSPVDVRWRISLCSAITVVFSSTPFSAVCKWTVPAMLSSIVTMCHKTGIRDAETKQRSHGNKNKIASQILSRLATADRQSLRPVHGYSMPTPAQSLQLYCSNLGARDCGVCILCSLLR